jgi:hypothetical protein
MRRGEHDHAGGLSPHETTQEALRTLEAGIDAILTSEAFAEYLRNMARFHAYSAGNIALIWTKSSAPTVVRRRRFLLFRV